MIGQHLALIDVFDEQVAAFDQRIREAIEGTRPTPPPDGDVEATQTATSEPAPTARDGAWAAQAILDAVPGIGRRVSEILLAELGTDMSRFPSRAREQLGRAGTRAT
jgi:hypothetical protein